MIWESGMMSDELIREAINRLIGKNRYHMEKIWDNYNRKGRPEDMSNDIIGLCYLMLDEIGEEE